MLLIFLPGGTSNKRIKTILNISEGCETMCGNKAILLIDLRKRDDKMLVKRDANQNESTSEEDRENNLLSALAQWQEENHGHIFPSSKEGQNNVVYAEMWDYCTMAYFRGFLVSEKRQAGANVVFEDKFPKKEHFEKVAEVMVHQRIVEDLAFRIMRRQARSRSEATLESLAKKLEEWSAGRPKNDLGEVKFKASFDEVKTRARELELWDDVRDTKAIEILKGDIIQILSSKSVSACLINSEQQEKDSLQLKQNFELFNTIIGNRDPPKLHMHVIAPSCPFSISVCFII